MSQTDSHRNLDFGGFLDQIKGFASDRCSGIRALINPDKSVASTPAQSKPSSRILAATGAPVSNFPRPKVANSRPIPTSIGTPLDEYVSREELGRATWLLLHTLAAQYPDTPTKQQRKDVTAMVGYETWSCNY